ncbi:glycogen synthase GlgA [Desulforamulus ferrireducens]|uniref:Glycogen synthase n=1 Tax=Desulforamulus ferrireducens TaxID=1833852 RepID=A0A1S6IVT0_9FIRM|nr:glycogen synthase GlgA [Desulforamulus ferrireducens]AQS58882.1 starch synthase [Desulforamulus ferrireducens]
MSILFVAAEGVPFIKSGGLADVIGSLPRELRKLGIDVRVMLPKYRDIPEHFKEAMEHCCNLTVPLSWRQLYGGVQRLDYEGVPFYFIDNEYYFKRSGIYCFDDEAERFAFFCRAALEALPHLDFRPRIIHCHDWHTGMISVFLQAFYRQHPFYQDIRTVFTIHNLEYQGLFPRDILGDVLGLPDHYFTLDGLEFYGQVSFIKGGLNFSDLLTTVSESYAQEIQHPYFGARLDGLLRHKKNVLFGILNGIDTDIYNPAADPLIHTKYNWQTPELKGQNKKQLQASLSLPVREDVPLIGLVSRLVSQKGMDLIAHIWQDIMQMDVQMVVLGTGEPRYEELFRYAARQYPTKMSANIFFGDQLAHNIYAASDLFLMPSLYEPCGLGQLIALRYGALPLVRETGGLKDTVTPYNQYTGEGNGFSFTNYNAHDLLHTLRMALSLYPQRQIWSKLVVKAMQADFSWYKSAQKYQNLYKRLGF